MSRPLSVSSRMASLGSRSAGETDVHGALHHVHAEVERVALGARAHQELARAHLALAALGTLGVERGAEELDARYPGDLDGILEAEEQARGGALVRLERKEV